MLIHGGTRPPVAGDWVLSGVQLAPRSRERTMNSGPCSVFVGGGEGFCRRGA
jgi:hypothetical protein